MKSAELNIYDSALLAGGEFRKMSNSLNPDQARQNENVGPDQGPYCVTFRSYSYNILEKK